MTDWEFDKIFSRRDTRVKVPNAIFFLNSAQVPAGLLSIPDNVKKRGFVR